MSTVPDIEGWCLERTTDDDIDELVTWFDSEASVRTWGGPNIRYPINRESFVEDCHWHDMATFSLRGPDGVFSAFGQLYERHNRINLARLIVHPTMRGQGVGIRLMKSFMSVGTDLFPCDEYSLFVYRDNTPAIECYRKLGFVIQAYPPDRSLADVCFYMICPVAGRSSD